MAASSSSRVGPSSPPAGIALPRTAEASPEAGKAGGKPPRRRRSFLPRFGLRSLLVVALLFCPLFAWLGNNVHRVRQEDAAIEAILRTGGGLNTEPDPETGSRPKVPLDPSVLPILERAGDVVFRSVGWRKRPAIEIVELRSTEAGDPVAVEAAAALADLPEIKTVSLTGPAFDDASLLALNHLPRLEALVLSHTSTTADGLAKIVTPRQIEYLSVRYAAGDIVSGARAFRSLRKVHSVGVQITQEDIAALASLPHLEELDFEGVHLVGDDVLTPLAGAGKLRSLEVDCARPPDPDDLQVLATLPRLERLLMFLREGDLPLLAPATKLRYLDARLVSVEAGRDFSLGHPECVMRLRGPTLGSVYMLDGELVERPPSEASY